MAVTVLGCCSSTSCLASRRRCFSPRLASMASSSFSSLGFLTTRTMRSCTVLASNPNREGKTSSDESTDASSFQEDLNYLWQLGAGSVAGAALVKYGSVLFPEITRPNIIQALVMISTPVIVAVFLLIKETRSD